MNEQQVIDLFLKRQALLEGHFLLSSGLHSSKYLQCALVLQYPSDAEALGRSLAVSFTTDQIDVVVAPALGGVIIGYEVARALNLRSIFTEREAGTMKLRRGFSINPGEKALVVEDVITTGGSTREVISVVESYGGEVVAVGSLIDRSGGTVEFAQKRAALATLTVPTYQPTACPMCEQGSIAIKPGSRTVS
ncbi:MAG: orotate phosphoribosyltransferase [Blastocatellia bacterium]|nr:orotate phosphoribosyltransferase [Blastocatellia bacterium]